MRTHLTRREFLKISTALSLGIATPKFLSGQVQSTPSTNQQNILILVFDAWSAKNLSLYGYLHPTTPHLNQLVDKAIVYHNHFAGGHFTSPGTLSLLTGLLPWTHRAFSYEPILDQDLLQKNIFNAFSQYYRFAYSHNPLVDHLLRYFMEDLEDYLRWEKLYFEYNPLLTLFRNDQDVASMAWNRTMKRVDDGYSYSLLLSQIDEKFKTINLAPYAELFPRGIPTHDNEAFFTLEQGIDWLYDLSQTAPQPFLGYYHFYPPHDPYHTRVDFINQFDANDYVSPGKPLQIFKDSPDDYLDKQRRYYDEFILYIDAEFARLYQRLERSGILENTWVILTSDHGEMFERGINGHTSPVFYQPIINVPLMIFPPGQKERIDIYDKTSAVDVFPTLLNITGQEVPSWIEGVVLPPFAQDLNGIHRAITSVQVEKIKAGEITSASAMCVRDQYKAMWLFGYKGIPTGHEIIELYDIDADPEERVNLYPERKEIADELMDILELKMHELNLVYKASSQS